MEKHEETRYVKRTQKITMSFKLQLVQEIERGQLTVTAAKYSIQNRTTVVQWLKFGTLIGKIKHHLLCQSHQKKIMELEAKVKLLEKQKSFWNKPLLQIKKQSF
jgi:transposase-like protein